MSDNKTASAGPPPGMKPTNLLQVPLAEHDGIEIVVSHVEVTPDAAPPDHYHPGEEFAYVQSGEVSLLIKGQPEQTFKAGEACVVPPRAVHTIRAKEPTTLVVFRVHDHGAPVRVIVKPDGEEIPMDR